MSEASEDVESRARRNKRVLLAVQIVVTLACFGLLFWFVDLGELWDAAKRMPLWAILACVALSAVNLVQGAARWRTLLGAYGAPERPPLGRLVVIYYVGHFYNTYLPGGLGGDVVRGVVTRRAFGERGVTGALTVVLVERVLGLTGLLLIVSAVILVASPEGTEDVLPYAALGLAAAFGAVGGVALARRIAPVLPGPLGRLAGSLPTLTDGWRFLLALAYSLGTQTVAGLSGYVLMVALDPSVTLSGAMVVVPLAAASAFLPITVGGAGAREGAFVWLAGAVSGLEPSEALACSFMLWFAQLAVAGVGGILQWVTPITVHDGPTSEPPG